MASADVKSCPRREPQTAKPEPPALALWRHLHDGRPDLLHLQSAFLRDGHLVNQRDHYYRPDQRADAAAWAAEQDRCGREVYFCVSQLLEERRVTENAAPSRVVHADLDGAPLKGCPIRPTVVVETSPGHFHCYWRLSRPLQPEKIKALNRRMALATGADTAAVDAVRLLRVPGTHNRKQDRTEVKLLYVDDDRALDPAELDAILPELPKPTPTHAPAAELSDDDADLVAVLARHRPAFRELWRGNASAYAQGNGQVDESAADWGMAQDLARACGGDLDRAERLMRQSALVRPKWDDARNGTTYLRYTLERAAAQPSIGDTGCRLRADPTSSPGPETPAPNGHCTPPCQRHQEEVRLLRDQIARINALVMSDLPLVYRVSLLRLAMQVGFHQLRGMVEFTTTATKLADSVHLSAQTMRKVLNWSRDTGLLGKTSTSHQAEGRYWQTTEIQVLTSGGYVGFLDVALEVARAFPPQPPKPRPPKPKAERPAELPEFVERELDCPEHVAAPRVITCADCGDELVEERRYYPVGATAYPLRGQPFAWLTPGVTEAHSGP